MSTQTKAGQPNSSFLASYRPDLFVEHDGWKGLIRILQSRGAGSFGLSGPRGSGKTWLMERALTWADKEGGVGVWFPSPSEYEPTAFLAALSDVVAARYEAYYDRLTRRPTLSARRRFMMTVLAAALSIYAAAGLVLLGLAGSSVNLGQWLNVFNVLALLLFVSGVLLMYYASKRRTEDREGLGRIRRADRSSGPGNVCRRRPRQFRLT